ncbi:MAG: SecY-interacting protein [Paraglaciecola sp.]|uniref:SecY-interacting protein n=1 Tax=Paraglaciecola sp. TaxID=1920173 RepID=UPI00329934FE
MSGSVSVALSQFVEKYLRKASVSSESLTIEYDPQWPSLCYVSKAEVGEPVSWQPVKRKCKGDFSDIESALNVSIHTDLIEFYNEYWSDNLNAIASKGSLQLLQAWNEDDFLRLQQNLVGHVLMKQRLKQPITLFFGLTEDDDFIITLDNQSGEVMLEQVGLLPKEVLAPNLASFLHSLEPNFAL